MEKITVDTCVDEINETLKINIQMLEKEGIVYLLDFKCLKTMEIDKAIYEHKEHELYVSKIYPYIISINYRAQQRLFYEQLPIFKGLLPLINEGIDSFYAEKYISSYVSLVPVIEGLILRWAGKKGDTSSYKVNDLIEPKITNLLETMKDVPWCCHNLKLLDHIICNYFYKRSSEKTVKTMFNRNVVSHLLNDPEYLASQKNTLRLLTIIDLIAICYSYDYKLETGGVIGNSYCYKYQELGQETIAKYARHYSFINSLSKFGDHCLNNIIK